MEHLSQNLLKIIDHFHNELAKVQVWRAQPGLLESVHVQVYGQSQPLKNIASIGVMDPQTLKIDPWDRSNAGAIDRGIQEANLGLNPQNMGEYILVRIPALTQERRKDLVKLVNKMEEEAKISVRNARQDAIKAVKQKETAKEIGEDIAKTQEQDIQKAIDEANKKIAEMTKKKEEDMMKV